MSALLRFATSGCPRRPGLHVPRVEETLLGRVRVLLVEEADPRAVVRVGDFHSGQSVVVAHNGVVELEAVILAHRNHVGHPRHVLVLDGHVQTHRLVPLLQHVVLFCGNTRNHQLGARLAKHEVDGVVALPLVVHISEYDRLLVTKCFEPLDGVRNGLLHRVVSGGAGNEVLVRHGEPTSIQACQ